MEQKMILAGDYQVVEEVRKFLVETGCCEENGAQILRRGRKDGDSLFKTVDPAFIQIAVAAASGGAVATIVKTLVEYFEPKAEIEYYEDGSIKKISFERMKKEEAVNLLRQIKMTVGV